MRRQHQIQPARRLPVFSLPDKSSSEPFFVARVPAGRNLLSVYASFLFLFTVLAGEISLNFKRNEADHSRVVLDIYRAKAFEANVRDFRARTEPGANCTANATLSQIVYMRLRHEPAAGLHGLDAGGSTALSREVSASNHSPSEKSLTTATSVSLASWNGTCHCCEIATLSAPFSGATVQSARQICPISQSRSIKPNQGESRSIKVLSPPATRIRPRNPPLSPPLAEARAPAVSVRPTLPRQPKPFP